MRDSRKVTLPVRYPDAYQRFTPTYENPYPMSPGLPPNPQYSVTISYNGIPMSQTLNPSIGPMMVPTCPDPKSIWCTPYPTNHSVPTPYQMWYIGAMGRPRY